jgi:predicted  nucleic acid-binding Zn-ribbon protein
VKSLAAFGGKCSRCGREYFGDHSDVVVCSCWEVCPECGLRMEPYVPDLSPNTYAKDGKRDLLILRVCNNHIPPFFSELEPVEVELTSDAR